MIRNLKALASGEFDVLVIGGGIFGAGIARDATLRGLRVALIDKADFASGASSRSTKLIHGGFRYLEQAAVGLVAESCRERRILQEIAPHLVKPQSFLFTVYAGDSRPLWKINLGMTLYDLLAAYRNPGRHRRYGPRRALAHEPALNRQGLQGAVLFHDCQEDDARFCLDNLFHAAQHGAVCANYCALTGFVKEVDRLAGARVTDELTGESFPIRARVFINAAGPWAEQVANLAPLNGRNLRLSPTKGVHLVLPRLTERHGVFFQARRDGRLIFVVPWLDCSLLGSTDTDFTGDPATAATEPADIEYLLTELRTVMPDARIQASDIITTFAGVRPLLHSSARPSARSREERIVWHGKNFMSVAGGKYTTYRAVAEQVVDQLGKHLERRLPVCATATTPLPEHRPPVAGEQLADVPEVYASDIDHACREEMALTLSDVMRRRTPLALSRHGGKEVAERVARVMAAALGWSEEWTRRQVDDYLAERTRGTL